MPVKLSYINARGEEIILDDDENTFAHELVGRTGFEMPQIDTQTVEYGDGTQDIVVAKMKSRTVTCYFWVDLDDKTEFERELRNAKAKMMQVGSRMGDWGQLRVRQLDGTYVYLNCIYKSGFDGLVRDSNVRLKFSLTFEATDPLFYYGHDTEYVIGSDPNANYLMMVALDNISAEYDFDDDNSTEKPNGVYMKELAETSTEEQYDYTKYDFSKDNITDNPNAVYMETANMTTAHDVELDCQRVYPTIKITGTGQNISLYNKLTGRKIDIDSSVTVDGKKYLLIETKPLHRKAVLVTEATGAEESILSALSADTTLEWYLERGENQIVYKNSDVSPASACTFIYKEGFLSAE